MTGTAPTEYYGHCPKCGELLGFGHLPEKCGSTAPTPESKCPTCGSDDRRILYKPGCVATGEFDPWHDKQEWCVTTAKRAFVNTKAEKLDAEIVSESKCDLCGHDEEWHKRSPKRHPYKTVESKPTSEGARTLAEEIVADVFPSMDAEAALRYVQQAEKRIEAYAAPLRSQLAAAEKERALLSDADKVPLIWKIREAYKTAHQYHIRHGEISSIDGCKHDLCRAISRAWSEAAKVLLAKGVDLDVIDETAITIPALKAEIQRLRERIAELEGSK